MAPRTVQVTLTHGATYTLGKRKFEYGVPQLVDGDTADYLEANALADVKITSGNKTNRSSLPKFKFELLAEAEDEPDEEVAKEPEVGKGAEPTPPKKEEAAKPAAPKAETTAASKPKAAPRQRGAASKPKATATDKAAVTE